MRWGIATRFPFKTRARPTARHKTTSVSRLVLVATVASQALVFAAAAAPAGAAPAVALPAAVTGTITEFRPAGISQTATSDPLGITTGPDGNLWFTDAGASTIATITPSGTGLAEFKTNTGAASPVAITTGPDGRLWFTELSGSVNQVARSTTTGTQNEFGINKPSALPTSIVTGPDAHMWFTDFGNGTIGTIDPNAAPGTVATTFPITNPALMPDAIASGPNGHLWFTEQGANGGKIGEMTTAGVQVSDTQAASSTGAGIAGITVGPDGNLWFTEQSHGRIGKVTPGHIVTEFPSLSGNGAPTAITAGSDGALWFIDQGNNAIGRITTSGSVTEFPVPTPNAFSPNVQPTGITSGPDGNIWFTEQDTKAAIGRIIVGSPAGAVTASPSSVTFGNQNVGTSSPATVVTLKNGTTAIVHVNSTATSGANAGDFQLSNNSCPGANLAAGSSCKVSVTFHPTASGARSATLTFNDTAGLQTVSLSGQASTCDMSLIAVLLRLLGLLPPCS
ncbi:MAG TPA: choice-of-anchor D domain-containing protein [Actinomycetota bacterium]|nr:choice-of-anchor D domain-containing protein [Actinomycetota bacterium]